MTADCIGRAIRILADQVIQPLTRDSDTYTKPLLQKVLAMAQKIKDQPTIHTAAASLANSPWRSRLMHA